MFEVLWVPTHYCPDLHVQDMANIPFYDILTNIYHIPLARAVETIEPALADHYTTELMGVDRKTLFLLVEHTSYTLMVRTSSYRTLPRTLTRSGLSQMAVWPSAPAALSMPGGLVLRMKTCSSSRRPLWVRPPAGRGNCILTAQM